MQVTYCTLLVFKVLTKDLNPSLFQNYESSRLKNLDFSLSFEKSELTTVPMWQHSARTEQWQSPKTDHVLPAPHPQVSPFPIFLHSAHLIQFLKFSALASVDI